ncbi:MAG TPA: GNAT family protein [Verrucomicrobiae bacterium]|nr:GNAT family protein [Verrucomicrobiae bacterium]
MITEENFIDFKCPYCGEPVSFPQANAKSLQACPSCMEALLVPETTCEVGRKIPIPITTARLILRRLQSGDWKDLLALDSDGVSLPLVQRGSIKEGTFLMPRGAAEEGIVQWLEHDSSVKLTTPDESFYLGIEIQDGGKLIGLTQLDFTDTGRLQAWINIQVSPSYQRNGIATEATLALLDFSFNDLALHRVKASCDSRDVAARGLCEKVGMRCEGESLKDRLINSEWVNTVWYARLDEDHRETNSGNPPESAA